MRSCQMQHNFRWWWFMQIRQRIFKLTDMQVLHFFWTKFGNFWHTTRLSTSNRRKVINSGQKNSPAYFGPTCRRESA